MTTQTLRGTGVVFRPPVSGQFKQPVRYQLRRAPSLAFRATYVGELGWELYIPTEYVQ